MNTKLVKFFSISLFLLFFSQCKQEEDVLDCIPNNSINVSINILLAAYQNLQTNGGWIYYNGALSGNRGLIIVNTGSGYKAYDRNAPHICPTSNSTLKVEDDIKIICEADGAEWILTTGQPISVAGRNPITYYVSVNGSVLNISN